jgi:hypothetical protein
MAESADQLHPSHVGRAFIDTPELDALSRLAHGPVNGARDLLAAESALRGILLHVETCTLNECDEQAWLSGPFGQFLTRFPSPQSVPVPSGYVLPVELQRELTAMVHGPDAYIQAHLESALGGASPPTGLVLAGAMSAGFGQPAELYLLGPNGPSTSVPVPALLDILFDANVVMQRALRLGGAYFGSAGIFASDVPSEFRGASLMHPIAPILEKLNESFDPAPDAACLKVPPLLSTVLEHSRNRHEIPSAVGELRLGYAKGARELHETFRLLKSEASPAAKATVVKRLDQDIVRMNKLLGMGQERTTVRLRGVGIRILAALFAIPSHNWALIGTNAAFALHELAKEFPGWDTNLTPSLVDSVVRTTAAARDLPPRTLLERHLSQSEIQRIDQSLT